MVQRVDRDGLPLADYRCNENADKALNALSGLCAGLLADGKLCDVEIVFLHEWLTNQSYLRGVWPASEVVTAIELALEDGYISEDERAGLTVLIGKIVGGGFQETGEASGLSTQLPIDPKAKVVVPDRRFCITGRFSYGGRKEIHEEIELLGGIIQKNVIQSLNYLVIGDHASRDWINTSHGRKIEKAVKYQGDGFGVHIIGEQQLVKLLTIEL